jgi:hypothetical protein
VPVEPFFERHESHEFVDVEGARLLDESRDLYLPWARLELVDVLPYFFA